MSCARSHLVEDQLKGLTRSAKKSRPDGRSLTAGDQRQIMLLADDDSWLDDGRDDAQAGRPLNGASLLSAR